MTTPTTHDDPLELANECTVEDIRRWMRAWAEQMTARQMTVPEAAQEHMQALLEGLWESDEPEPTPHELLALLSLPACLRRHIEVDVAASSYRFVGKVRVINRIGRR